jgi:diguanylate cyclase (GGDEF)-like protein
LVRGSFEGSFFSMLMVDIDRFKSINDNYGHDVGDEMLKMVANEILRSVRNVDIVGRIGGEEFCVVMINTKEKQGYEVAERIRATVEAAVYSHEEYGNLSCTVSIGMGVKTSISIDELFKKVDRMLYEAKKNGRNRIEVFPRDDEGE